jgi:hypothetical protein
MAAEGKIQELIQAASDINPAFGDLLEAGLEYMPYLGNLLQTIKFNRLKGRLDENSSKLESIGKLASETRLSLQYINERIFPIVLSDIYEEHEDAKVILIFNGFENVFIDEKSEESVVINYFDTLRSLRYVDIKRFFYLAGLMESYPLYSLDSEEQALIRNIDRKLNSLGILTIKTKIGEFQGMEFDNNPDDAVLTLYGRKFLEFMTPRV